MKGNINFMIQSYVQLAKMCDVNEADKKYEYMKKAEELLELSATKSKDIIAENDECDYDEYQITQLQKFLEGKERTCILQIWCELFANERKPKREESSKIAKMLEAVNWQRAYPDKFGKYGSQRIWKNAD